MAIITNGSNTRVRLSFLAVELASKKISLFTIENRVADAFSGLPTDPLFPRKYQWTDNFNMQNEYIGQSQGQEQIEQFSIPFTFTEDFLFVKKYNEETNERLSRDMFVNILQGNLFTIGGKNYRVLGNTGNINLKAKMTGKNTNNKWKNLFYWENAFVRDGIATSGEGVVETMRNPLLSSFSLSNIGMCMEVYIGAGSGETRVMRFPLVSFNQIKTNLDGETVKISTNMEIKADPIESKDFFVAGGKQVTGKFIPIHGYKYSAFSGGGTYTVPAEAKANETFLDIDNTTGIVKLIKNKVDVTPTTPLEVGTIFYMLKDDTGATAGGATGLCQASGKVVKKSPTIFVVGTYDCTKPESRLTQWNLEDVTITATNAKDIFPLHVLEWNENDLDFKRYDTEDM